MSAQNLDMINSAVAAQMPMVACWMGTPVHELSREELHAAFCHLIAENEKMRQAAIARSVAEIRRLADRLTSISERCLAA